ncbi:MAG TPA: LacI family DNA-binding transcriptional regulator [Micromonosporaceae bacterium]|nr:LacI family DNA-binding transcriptional regulator [Micromonosporaceae bacterium]
MASHRRGATRQPTLDHVAARAGVGRGTASRVLNGSPQVSPATRRAVEQAISDLGYVPNRAARTLVTQRADSVALVVSESQERLFGEPFFAGIVRGVSSVLAGTPMQMWLAMAQSPADRQIVERHLTRQHVDGVLLLSLHDSDPLPLVLAERGVPTVLGGRPGRMLRPDLSDGEPRICYVDVDNSGGARAAVEYLLARGRRAVGVIAGPQDMGVGVARLAGYLDAIEGSGVPVDPKLIAYGDFTVAGGAAAMRKLLAGRPDLDAVFAASDLMAYGAIRCLQTLGRRVPQDVAVVGFDDSAIARQTEPPLTTVHQSVEEMGREMARLLLACISGEPRRSVVLDTHLVRRASA